MFRVVKADGWNKYKIQKRFLYFFWVDYDFKIITGRDTANFIADGFNQLKQ